MAEKIAIEQAFQIFLEQSGRSEMNEASDIILEYLHILFSEEEEPILLEEFSEYEVDDLLYFYLQDRYTEAATYQKKIKSFLREFSKFALTKGYLAKEEADNWKKVL